MAGVTTDTANDIGRVILPFGAVVLAMTDLTAILTGLVLIVTQCAVQSSQFTELTSLKLILTLGDRGSLDVLVHAIRSCLGKQEILTVSIIL